jgi:hypothetical protein
MQALIYNIFAFSGKRINIGKTYLSESDTDVFSYIYNSTSKL